MILFLDVSGIWCHGGHFYDHLCEDPSLLDGAQVNRGDKFLSVISVGEY